MFSFVKKVFVACLSVVIFLCIISAILSFSALKERLNKSKNELPSTLSKESMAIMAIQRLPPPLKARENPYLEQVDKVKILATAEGNYWIKAEVDYGDGRPKEIWHLTDRRVTKREIVKPAATATK